MDHGKGNDKLTEGKRRERPVLPLAGRHAPRRKTRPRNSGGSSPLSATRSGCAFCRWWRLRPEVCSCDLERPLGKSQPTISHHTKVLVKPGSSSAKKRGHWVWWRVDETRFAAIRKVLGG